MSETLKQKQLQIPLRPPFSKGEEKAIEKDEIPGRCPGLLNNGFRCRIARDCRAALAMTPFPASSTNYAPASAPASLLLQKATTNILFFSLMKRSKNHRLDINYAKNEFCKLNHTLYPTPSMIFNASIIHFLNAIYVCRGIKTKQKGKAKSKR